MNEQISFIVHIQDIDIELSKLDDEVSKATQEINELEQLIDSRKKELEILNEEAVEINKKIGLGELDVKSYEDKIIRMKDTQKLIKTNKEYNALQKSVKDNEALKKNAEDELISYMESRYSITQKITDLSKLIEEASSSLEGKGDDYKKNEIELDKTRKNFESKREDTAKKIKKDYLDIYEVVKKNKGFPAISPVMKSGACTGCYRMLPPQQFNELISGDIFMQCPVCYRILYIQPESPETQPVQAQGRGKNKKSAS